jgi:TetR/AcrR family transcriptional regulator, transcriptional repressor for nem operon
LTKPTGRSIYPAMTQAETKPASTAPSRKRLKRTSRDKLVQAARKLMLAQGYPVTSVDDIIKAAGVSKGSFYHYFGSKEELGLTAMHEFLADGAAIMMEGPFRDVADPTKRAIAFLKHVENVAMRLWDHGCLLVMFSVELAGTSPKVREETSAVLLDLIDRIGAILRPLTKDGGGNMPMTSKAIANMYMAIIDGSLVYARATGDSSYIVRNLRAFRQQIEAS